MSPTNLAAHVLTVTDNFCCGFSVQLSCTIVHRYTRRTVSLNSTGVGSNLYVTVGLVYSTFTVTTANGNAASLARRAYFVKRFRHLATVFRSPGPNVG